VHVCVRACIYACVSGAVCSVQCAVCSVHVCVCAHVHTRISFCKSHLSLSVVGAAKGPPAPHRLGSGSGRCDCMG